MYIHLYCNRTEIMVTGNMHSLLITKLHVCTVFASLHRYYKTVSLQVKVQCTIARDHMGQPGPSNSLNLCFRY